MPQHSDREAEPTADGGRLAEGKEVAAAPVPNDSNSMAAADASVLEDLGRDLGSVYWQTVPWPEHNPQAGAPHVRQRR
jgi:hypothetical protein